MKRFAGILLLSAFWSTLAHGLDEEVTLKTGSDLRARPSFRGKILETTLKGATGIVIEESSGGWKLLCIGDSDRECLNGTMAWANESQLLNPPASSTSSNYQTAEATAEEEVSPPPKADPTPQKPNQALNPIRNNATIRSAPGTKTSEITDYIPQSTVLNYRTAEADADGDIWYKVDYEVNGKKRSGYIFEGNVQAESETANDDADCPTGDCKHSKGKNIANQAAELADTFDPYDAKGYQLPRGFSPACSNFINRKGIGRWGRYMISAATRVAPGCFYHNNLFGSLCRGYSSLNPSQKNAMIALTFAAIAQTESNCRPNAQAQGIYATADGMFQLEYEVSARARAGRHPRWCRSRTPVNTQSWEFQSECAVSIIEDTVCSWGSYIFDRKGYWEKLRNNREITRRIRETSRKWGLCQ